MGKFSDQIGPLIRRKREIAKITQRQLADRADVGMATLQNIELGKGNPSIRTLEAVITELGLSLELGESKQDFEVLSQLGVPLSSSNQVEDSFRPDKGTLIATLRKQAPAIRRLATDSREGAALASFLTALRDHFPDSWLAVRSDLEDWLNQIAITGALIKLRRISIQNLAEYL